MEYLEKEIRTTRESRAKYDHVAKLLASDKRFLAMLMKRFIPMYAEISVNDIAGKYIEPGPVEVSKTGVARDTSVIHGDGNEDLSKAEGIIYYDMIFRASYPGKTDGGEPEEISIRVNVELQNDLNPGYPLDARKVYYASRMLCSQLPNIDEHTNYGSLQQVYSIWLCIGKNVAKYLSGTAEEICYMRRPLIGDKVRKTRDDSYDLVHIVTAYVRDDDEIKDQTLRAVQTVFSKRLTADEKVRKLKSDGILINRQEKERMVDMCNLSREIWLEAQTEGRARGLAEGRTEGRIEGRVEGILIGRISAMHELGYPAEQIADKVCQPVCVVHEIIQSL